MSYRTVLAHLETEAQAEKVLPAAILLSKAQDAHLIGLHVIPASAVLPTMGYELPAEVWEDARKKAVAKGKAIGQRFLEACDGEALSKIEQRIVSARVNDVSDVVLEHARHTDIVITGQVNTDHSEGANASLTGNLILESGRPALVVPYAGTVRSLGSNVLVAWNGSKESARAVFDAMPLLTGAKVVNIYGVRQDTGTEKAPLIPGTELAATLAHHGVNAVVDNSPVSSGKIANDLLSRCADLGSDLLVMGGYGRSRARELVFGGATRDILRSMTVPVLMSH